MTIIEYVTEEVTRQGHDVTVVDGLERVAWMLDAWACAMIQTRRPELSDAIAIGRTVERHRNQRGVRTCGVRVGVNSCPKPEQVNRLLKLLFQQRDQLTPLEFYKEFELIHPFVDGNGRTGKILLTWLNGTLSNPVFPPSNLFGQSIRNP